MAKMLSWIYIWVWFMNTCTFQIHSPFSPTLPDDGCSFVLEMEIKIV